MTDLGPLSVNFTSEGFQALLNEFNKLKTDVKTMSEAFIKANKSIGNSEKELTRVVKEEANKRARAEREEVNEARKEYQGYLRERKRQEQKRTQDAKEESRKRARAEKEEIEDAKREWRSALEAFKKAEEAKTNAAKAEVEKRKRLAKDFIATPLAAGARRMGMMGGMFAGAAVSAAGGMMMEGAYENLKSTANQAATLEIVTAGRLKAKDQRDWALKRGSELGLTGEEMLSGQAELAKHLPINAKTMPIIGSKQIAEDIAMGSKAYEISTEDVGKLVSQFVDQTGGNEQQTHQFLLNAFHQAKNERIPMSDIASHVGKVGALVNKMAIQPGLSPEEQAGKRSAFFQQMMGFEQIAAKGGRVTATEAQTSTLRAFTRLESMTDKQLGKLGLKGTDIFADAGHKTLLPADQLLAGVIAKTRGSQSKMEQIFGPRAEGVVSPLLDTFNAAESKKAGSGMQAMMDQMKSAAGQGKPGDLEELKKDMTLRLEADPIQQMIVKSQDKLAADIQTHMPQMVKAMQLLTDSLNSVNKAGAATLLGGPVGTGVGAGVGALTGKATEKVVGKLAATKAGQTAIGLGAGALPALGLGAVIGAPVAAAIGTHMLNQEETLTLEQKRKGSAAQFADNKWDTPANQGIMDKFLIGLGGLITSIADATGQLKETKADDSAGPKGTDLPGSHK